MTFARAFAPATVANIGVGFDILGLAVQGTGDRVEVEFRDEPGARILSIEGDGGRLPREADKNTASVAAQAVLDTIGAQRGVGIRLYKDLPINSGLGSSAASAVAAAVAVNALFGSPLKKEALLPACMEGEACVSGYHADNVGPSLLGGITLITGTDVSQIYHMPVPEALYLALVTPAVDVPTAQARAVLPKSISLRDMVAQTGGVARLVDALYRGDIAAMGMAMEADCVVEPARAHLMPYLMEVRTAAKRAGACGLVISGAGPTLCAVCESDAIALACSVAMKAVYDDRDIASRVQQTQVDRTGARVQLYE
ncbi:MAG: homoserine kinase [Anaerolineaceae bacterium]|nr:homoserine kinase [Anaerolineaceae bacterium]